MYESIIKTCGLRRKNRKAIYFLVILLFYFLSFQSFAKKENIDKYKKLIIAKWFKTKEIFDIRMSLKIEGIPLNQLKEINNSFLPLLGIKKMFALDMANMNFEKKRKVLIIDNKDQPHYIETELECFKYIEKQYIPEKYGIDFIFDVLLFIKYCNGYEFAAVQKNIYFRDFLKDNPELSKKACKLEIKKNKNKFLCKAYFSTMNNNGIILIEISLAPNSVQITKTFEKIFMFFI